jgi:DNA invertase Pin-like site-specific DNA recombinase
MRRAVVYLRVSTIDQTTANQERELREIAGRMGCEIVRVYKDHGISGTRGRDKRPAFDKLCRDAARREFDVVMAWSVDRLGRSLQDLVGFLSELHALKIDLFLRQQGLDTWPLAARAQQQATLYTIGVLTLTSPSPEPLLKALPEGLRDVGYVEGRNLRLEIRAYISQRLPDKRDL